MSQSFLAYITWNRLVPWKILSLTERRDQNFYPVGYGAGKKRNMLRRVNPEDTIWVITMPRAKVKGQREKRNFRPSLVAHIKVKSICQGGSCSEQHAHGVRELLGVWKSVAVSDPDESQFFELNDATGALSFLGFLPTRLPASMDRKQISSLRSKLGRRLRSIVRLDASAQEVEKVFESSIRQASQQNIFISYARIDGEEFALELADAFLEQEFSPWLDALAIPRYDVKRENQCDLPRLKKILQLGIDRSAFAACVVTDQYRKKKDASGIIWTQREWDRIVRRNNREPAFRIACVMRTTRKLCSGHFKSNAESAEECALEIVRRWRQE